MLKTRVIPTILFKEVGLVKGLKFDANRGVGSALQSIKLYNMRDVDELIFMDIVATSKSSSPNFKLIDELSNECFMPLTVGGGIKRLEDIEKLLSVGADKVAINTAAVKNPDLIKQASKIFGSQCIVVAIDTKYSNKVNQQVVINCGTKLTGLNPVEWAVRAADLGAGEILLTSVDRDGTMKGYDLDLINSVSSAVNVPVIASGGAGSYGDMVSAILDGQASAVAAASIFHFTQMTPSEAKKYMHEAGIPTRAI
jgi:cyclase